jgi:hypothetical protein
VKQIAVEKKKAALSVDMAIPRAFEVTGEPSQGRRRELPALKVAAPLATP